MGILTSAKTGEKFMLRAENSLGRSHQNTLVLSEPVVSSQHARLMWSQERWTLRDLNSRNGTLVNGAPVKADVTLQKGDSLAFGSLQNAWILTSAEAPALMARNTDSGEEVFGTGDMLTLPSEDEPEVTIYRSEQSGWCAESSQTTTPVGNNDVVVAGGSEWRLTLPMASTLPVTAELDSLPLLLANIRLRFGVTLDEEHVNIHVHTGMQEHDLASRAYHYMLLLLARRREQDAAQNDLQPSAHGWIYQSELMQMLGLSNDLNRFNVHICRARKRFIELGIEDAPQIIERRPDVKQLRIGVSSFLFQRL